jgi:hypothetical protein
MKYIFLATILLNIYACGLICDNQQLIEAAYKGDTKKVESLLNSFVSCNVNATDSGGRTALHYAAFIEDPKMADLLIKAGANVDLKDVTGSTALMLAAYHGHFETVKILVQAGADIFLKDKFDTDVFKDVLVSQAYREEHLKIFKYLVDEALRKTNNKKKLSHVYKLCLSSTREYPEYIEYLVSKGIPPAKCDMDKFAQAMMFLKEDGYLYQQDYIDRYAAVKKKMIALKPENLKCLYGPAY